MNDEWIIVVDWERFQHYGHRQLLWIKVYVELMRADKWLRLGLSARGLLVSIWLLWGPCRGQLRTSDLSAYCLQKVRRQHLDSLVEAGFIELSASRPPKLARPVLLAENRKPASPEVEVEKEVEEETPLPPQDVGDNFFEEPTPKPGTRASGTNPRAVAKRETDQDRRRDVDRLLEAAREIAADWNGEGSDLFDDQIDALERQHPGAQLSYLERATLWDVALKRADTDEELF